MKKIETIIDSLREEIKPNTVINAVAMNENLKRYLSSLFTEKKCLLYGIKIFINPFLPDDIVIIGNENKLREKGII